jgi:hypothetical protein
LRDDVGVKPIVIGWVAFGLVSMAVAWAIFKNPPSDVDAGSFWAVVLLFAIPLLGFGIAATSWSSQLRRHGRVGAASLSTGLGVLLLVAFAVIVLWAVGLTLSDH